MRVQLNKLAVTGRPPKNYLEGASEKRRLANDTSRFQGPYDMKKVFDKVRTNREVEKANEGTGGRGRSDVLMGHLNNRKYVRMFEKHKKEVN